ncbi:MAG: helix-turn-helix domain-containing protein [Bacteroidales bacterium]|nr:helix-turn-helix domain-containing protein [Bacteroidales bacterium]
MNRTDARLVAEELFKLIKKDGLLEDKVIGAEETAEILGCSTWTVYKKLSEIPHTKFGKSLRFFKSDIIKMLRR